MTRHDHRGRFTAGSRPIPRERGVPLFTAPPKSPPHVRGNATRRARWLALRDAMTARLRGGA